MPLAPAQHQDQQLQEAGDADGRGNAMRGIARFRAARSSSAIITVISAILNNSGEKAVRAERPCALASASSTVAGPAKAR